MEEAMSGPVDKDTSSYGDRTAQAGQGQTGASNAQAGQGQMMLSIPANGNLDGMMSPAQSGYGEQSKQKSAGEESELEREAGPIKPNMDASSEPEQQQQMMELRSARQSAGRSGRLNRMNNKSARQQQQSETDYSTKQASTETGFGEEQTKNAAKMPATDSQSNYNKQSGNAQSMYNQPQSGAGKSMAGASYAPEAMEEQQQQQQSSAGPAEGEQQQPERSYAMGGDDQQMLAKQRAMAAMLMSMNSGMKYSRMSSMMNAGAQYGEKKPSNMAQNMIMSLASKAAYMGQQQQQSQRQMAPPVMMMMMPPMSANYVDAAKPKNADSMMNAMMVNQMMNQMQNSGSGSYSNGMRGMRRANQRRADKISPAMMNAMLNKMMAVNKREQSAGYSSKPMNMNSMKPSPMMAEMMANLMMPKMSTSMPAAKRNQYKRMMMAALMQQPAMSAESDYGSGQDAQQQQQSSDSYAQQMDDKATGKSADGYTSTMSPNSMMMMSLAKPDMYASQKPMLSSGTKSAEAEQMEGPVYGDQQMRDMSKGMSKSPRMSAKPMSAYGSSMEKPMSMSMQMPMNKMNAGDAADEQQKQSTMGYDDSNQQQMMPAKSGSGYGMDQPSMMKSGSPMNGFRQAYQPAMQQQKEEASKGASSYGSGQSSGTKSGDSYSTQMARPVSMMSGQQGYDAMENQQQQTDDYGAAPMGMAEPFAFDYKIEDDYGNGQYRKEESDKNGVVKGSYGYTDTSGIYRHVEYVADENGFRANIKSNEPGLSSEPSKTSQPAMQQADAGMQMQPQMPMMMPAAMANQQQQQQSVEEK